MNFLPHIFTYYYQMATNLTCISRLYLAVALRE